jgi:hypothetical protein
VNRDKASPPVNIPINRHMQPVPWRRLPIAARINILTESSLQGWSYLLGIARGHFARNSSLLTVREDSDRRE